jgi:hypothetical protein
MSQISPVDLFLLLLDRQIQADMRFERQGRVAPVLKRRVLALWEGMDAGQQEEARAVLLATGWRVPAPFASPTGAAGASPLPS